jgi:hypothetical protein
MLLFVSWLAKLVTLSEVDDKREAINCVTEATMAVNETACTDVSISTQEQASSCV